MDFQSVATQLISALAANPELITQFSQHPYSTTAQLTGTDETISQKDMSRVLTQIAAQAAGQSLGTADTKSIASALLGQSGGSVHELASMLFGGQTQQTASASSGAAAGFDLNSLLGVLGGMATSSAQTSNANAAQGTQATGPSMTEIAVKSIAGAVAARGLASLITGAMSQGQQQ